MKKNILNITIIVLSILLLSGNVYAKKAETKTNTNTNEKKELKKLNFQQKAKLKSVETAKAMYAEKHSQLETNIDYNIYKTEPISLNDCIKLAIANNPTIMSAISNSEIYKTKIGQAWSSFFPVLTAGLSYSRNDMLMTMGGAFAASIPQKYNMFYVPTLSAEMKIFDFGKTQAQAEVAKKTFESTKYDAETSIEYVVYNVKVAYYNMLFAQKQKEVYENTVQDYELQLKQARAYFDIGKKAKIDVTYAEYNLGKAKLNLIKAKNTLDVARVELANAIGIPQLENVVLKDELNTIAYDVNFPDLINIAESTRPSLLAASKRMEAAEYTVKSVKRAFTPEVNIFGSYNHGGREINADYGYQFGGELTYSNVNLMLLKKQVDEAQASYLKSVADFETEKQNVYLDVKSAYINLINSKDSIDVAKLSLQYAKEQQYQAFKRYQVGYGDAIEFKDSENTYLNAQLDYYNTLLQYNINAADIERVIGAPIATSNIKL